MITQVPDATTRLHTTTTQYEGKKDGMSAPIRPSPWPLNPLTPYDILGYLAPGGTLLLSLYGFEYWVRHWGPTTVNLHTPIYTVLHRALPAAGDNGWSMATLFLISLFGVCYVLGHIVASVSAFAIDRIYVSKGHGYPYRLLLNLSPEATREGLTRNFYRAIFFWINVGLILSLSSLSGVPFSQGVSFLIVRLIVVAISLLISLMVILKLVVGARHRHKETALKKWLNGPGTKVSDAIETFIRWANAPYAIFTILIGNYLRTHEALPKKVRESFRTKFLKSFGMTPDEAGTTTFWFSYMYVRGHSDRLSDPAENWLRLYSFARNLGTGLYLAFLYILVWWILNASQLDGLMRAERFSLVAIALGLLLGAFFMLLRYYYLYAEYFSKYVLRAFLYVEESSEV